MMGLTHQGALLCPSDLVRQSGSLLAAVGLVDIAYVQNAGHQHFSYHRPLVQSGGTLHGDADTVQYGPVRLLAAGDEGALLPGDVLAAHHQGIEPVDDTFDLGGDGIPVHRHGKDKDIGLQDSRGDGVEVVVKGTGFPGFEAGLAGMTAANLQKGRVKAGDGVALFSLPLG